jgi:hypothetical protein
LAGYNSYYKREPEEMLPEKPKSITNIKLAGPMLFWVGLIIIAVIFQVVAIPFAMNYGRTNFNGYINAFANSVLYTPGIVILPLMVSLWIGDRVSFITGTKSHIAMKGVLNAAYSIMIYTVAIVIAYIIMTTQQRGVFYGMTMPFFVLWMILIPALINITIIPIFAVLSSIRRNG